MPTFKYQGGGPIYPPNYTGGGPQYPALATAGSRPKYLQQPPATGSSSAGWSSTGGTTGGGFPSGSASAGSFSQSPFGRAPIITPEDAEYLRSLSGDRGIITGQGGPIYNWPDDQKNYDANSAYMKFGPTNANSAFIKFGQGDPNAANAIQNSVLEQYKYISKLPTRAVGTAALAKLNAAGIGNRPPNGSSFGGGSAFPAGPMGSTDYNLMRANYYLTKNDHDLYGAGW